MDSPSTTPSAPAAVAAPPASSSPPTDRDAAFRTMIASLRKKYPLAEPGASPVEPAAAALSPNSFGIDEPILIEFIRSMLIWEASLAKAASALKRFEQHLVDVNELRICMPPELVKLLGERYPRAEERAIRLRTALNEVFRREHAVTLQHLTTMTKKESREYLESLEGVPGFVSARVQLVSIGGHAAPVDRRILARLVSAGFIDADAATDTAASLLERKVPAGEMLETYMLLQAWADDTSADELPAGDRPSSSKKKPSPSESTAATKNTKKPGSPVKKKNP